MIRNLKKYFHFFRSGSFVKKKNLITAGETCKYHFFVLKGCIRKFCITPKGTEQTTEFAIETWWLTDNMAYEHQLRTDFSIQAVEKSEILYIEYRDQEKITRNASKNGTLFQICVSACLCGNSKQDKIYL